MDSTPIGANVRSTVATYSGVLDDLRRLYAKGADARERGLKAGDFSYNTGSLRCPTCEGTGQISLDVQFLPDVDIPCPDCQGSRYGNEAYQVRLSLEMAKGGALERETARAPELAPEGDRQREGEAAREDALVGPEEADLSLPELLSLTVDEALAFHPSLAKAAQKLRTLHDLGLGYLTLGEATPALSGGEAQRLKLASEMQRSQAGTLFVFDEPTIGLHPLDVETLLHVLQRLVDHGATVVVIEHVLALIANADYGRIVAEGTPEAIAADPASITGRYLAEELGQGKGRRI